MRSCLHNAYGSVTLQPAVTFLTAPATRLSVACYGQTVPCHAVWSATSHIFVLSGATINEMVVELVSQAPPRIETRRQWTWRRRREGQARASRSCRGSQAGL